MPLKLLFTGDVSFTGVYRDAITANREIFSEGLLDLFEESDFVIVNFEGPATVAPSVLRQDVFVVSPPESVAYALARRVNVFNLANNHIFDCGLAGYLDTVSKIDNGNALHLGGGKNLKEASKPLLLLGQDTSVALIGVCHREGLVASNNSPGVFCDRDFSALVERIAEVRERVDWIILNYHGGEEYTTVPMPRRRKLFRDYLNLDIDFIIAHHSHVMQGLEQVGQKVVFYSLGNFVFDIPGHKEKELTDRAALLQLNLTETDYTFQLVPTKMDRDEGTVEEAQVFANELDLGKLRHYKTAWLADAYRTFFQPNLKKGAVTGSRTGPSGASAPRSRKLFRRLLTLDLYVEVYRLLKGENSRPVFLGAVTFWLLKKAGIVRGER